MAYNFGLEAPICISKDSFEILRFSAFIWAQEKGHFMQKQVRKLCLKDINESLFLLLSWHCHIFGYCHVSLHISDNLSPNLISSDITGKQRSRAFIWHQAWWDYRQYWWRYGLLKRGARFAGRTCSFTFQLSSYHINLWSPKSKIWKKFSILYRHVLLELNRITGVVET